MQGKKAPVDNPPALTAQNPLRIPLKVMNIMNTGKAPFILLSQPLTAIRGQSNERL